MPTDFGDMEIRLWRGRETGESESVKVVPAGQSVKCDKASFGDKVKELIFYECDMRPKAARQSASWKLKLRTGAVKGVVSGCADAPLAAPPSKSTSGFKIEHVYYINLDRRADRRSQIEGELQDAGFTNITRYSAWDGKDPAHESALTGCWDPSICAGQLGCQMSHVGVLQKAIDQGLSHVAVFEDDFGFRPSWKATNKIRKMLEMVIDRLSEWDVIGLGLVLQDSQELCDRVLVSAEGNAQEFVLLKLLQAQTTGGYIIHKRYMKKLMMAISAENCDVKQDYHTAIDQCWKPLMKQDHWFAFQPQPGHQVASYSDIEVRDVNYEGMMDRR